MHKRIFDPSVRFFIVIDGLDKCNDRLTQQTLLQLITGFCMTRPTSPIAWIVASRPEPHIISFFDKPGVRLVYTKEEMVIDSDEACEDVQRYLREALKTIKETHPTLRRKRGWPLEHEYTRIASAAGGLFAYAATVIRYIGDSTRGGPAAQLRRVLETIDVTAKDHVAGRDNPMDRLDALYKRILSNISDSVMINTRNLLLVFQPSSFDNLGFRGLCNALGLTEHDAYDAISPLHAVMKIPEPDKADDKISYYHKSFRDFLSTFQRSGFSRNFESESFQLRDHVSLKIIQELQDDCDGVAGGEDVKLWGGVINGQCGNISLSWPGDERFQTTDKKVRIALYRAAMKRVETCFSNGDGLFKSISCFHALTTRVIIPDDDYPFYRLRGYAFALFRDELAKLGKLKQVPLRTLDYAAICGNVELRFTGPTGSHIKVSDPWDTFCKHEKQGLDGLGQQRGWSTAFQRCYQVKSGNADDADADIPRFHIATFQQGHREWLEFNPNGLRGASVACINCSRRFGCHFMNNADQLAAVFVDSTQMCYVEVLFVDPDDGVSEWRYRFLHSGRPTSSDV